MNKLLPLLAVVALFSYAYALKCYECNSVLHDGCGMKFTKNSTWETDCNNKQDTCGKATVEIEVNKTTITTVTRGCVKKEDAEAVCKENKNNTSCYFCSKDLCNTGTVPASVSYVVYILPVTLYLLTTTSRV